MSAGPAGDDGLNPAGPVHGTRQLPVGVDAGTTTVDTAGTGGGDWYDVVTSVDGHLVLVVGDVLDTGVPAVAAMGQLRTALLAELLGGVAPGTALTHLNAQFGNALRGSYAIVVCLEFDPHTGRLCYASAGHPSPVCLGPEGQIDLLHRRPLGPPIGAGPDARYDTIESRLAPGRGCCSTARPPHGHPPRWRPRPT